MKYTVTVAGRAYEIEIEHDRLVWVNGRPLYVDLEQVGGLPIYSLDLGESGYVLFVDRGREGYEVEIQGRIYPVTVQLQRPQLGRPVACAGREDACLAVCAPLPGRLLALPVAVGEQVEEGQVVAVMESMKMKMELRAPRSAVVERIHGPPQRDVAQGETLVVLGDLS